MIANENLFDRFDKTREITNVELINGTLVGYARRVKGDSVLLHIDVGDDLGLDFRVHEQIGVNFRLGDKMTVKGGTVYWKNKVPLESVS
jgi:hypothetical protein